MKPISFSIKAAYLALAVVFAGAVSHTFLPQKAVAQIYDDEEEEEVSPRTKPQDPAIEWDSKRLTRLDRNVRKLERTIARLEGKPVPPVLIEPDPEVVALQATVDSLSRKVDDLSQTIVAQTGQIENLQYLNRQKDAEIAALNKRNDAMEKRIAALEARTGDIEVAIAPPPPPPASLGSADLDFEQAYGYMTSGKLDDAERAFTAFIDTWPEAIQRPEAWYRLGQIYTMKGRPAEALTAYATAVKGWPKTTWAPDATVRLAQSLLDTNRPKESCAALSQFDKLYAKMASAETRAAAKAIKTRAACAA